jgi:MoxR-like ATPase
VTQAAASQPFSSLTTLDPSTQECMVGLLKSVREEVEKVIVGQPVLLERVLLAILSGGHILIEGVPGLAKTRTVRTFAQVLGGSWQRVQFTPDLVPSDLVGTRMWLPGEGRFDFEPGPVHTNFLLADEINRAPAKVQSALLEAMEERQVTIARETVRLPDPFLVLATQNPQESEGTYPLPEAQTDRFMFRVTLEYPSDSEELEVLRRHIVGSAEPTPVMRIEDLLLARTAAASIYVPRSVADAIVHLVASTRTDHQRASVAEFILTGAGPRASLALVTAARSRAFLHGRSEVALGDVTDLAVDVLSHRLTLSHKAHLQGRSQRDIARIVLEESGLLG